MITLLEWAKKCAQICPNCGGKIGDHQVKKTAWCSKCNRIWKLHRSSHSWKVTWFYHKGEK